jgi:hypothetical protein
MATKYANIFHCETLKKFTQIGIFGFKIYHLATLVGSNSRAARHKTGSSLFFVVYRIRHNLSDCVDRPLVEAKKGFKKVIKAYHCIVTTTTMTRQNLWAFHFKSATTGTNFTKLYFGRKLLKIFLLKFWTNFHLCRYKFICVLWTLQNLGF